MSACIVWLDSKEANLFHLSAQGTQKEQIKKHSSDHSSSHDAHTHQEDEHFFHEIAKKLSSTGEILLMGPGLAKAHLKTHLEKHHHTAIANKIVGIETVEHLSESQVMEHARKFFKSYDAFH